MSLTGAIVSGWPSDWAIQFLFRPNSRRLQPRLRRGRFHKNPATSADAASRNKTERDRILSIIAAIAMARQHKTVAEMLKIFGVAKARPVTQDADFGG